MAITEADLKLFHSQEDSDFDSGGGMQTAAEIVDGALHNLFDARAQLDEVGGRVKIRKLFAGVDTDTQDRLQRGHLALTEIPADDRVFATLFSTRDYFDRHAAHAAYIEAYYVPAGKWNGYVYGTQVKGARAVEIWQRETAALPEVGTTYVLIQDEGGAAQIEQYVLCTNVAKRIGTFTDTLGDYTKAIVTMTISERLNHSFTGPDVSRVDPSADGTKAILRQTTAAGAAQYYGTKSLVAAADQNAQVVVVDTPFVQLVPASTMPVPHLDLNPNAVDTTLVPADNGVVSVALYANFGAGITLSLGSPLQIGSLSIQAGTTTLTDGKGTLYSGTTAVGTVNYPEGKITGSIACPPYPGLKTARFKPAAPLTTPQQSHAIKVAANTQFLVYTGILPTPPLPGTARIAYRAQGRWYELADPGDGVLVGVDSSYGVAQIRFATRSFTLSLTVLPDVDTWIVVTYGDASHTHSLAGTTLPKASVILDTVHDLAPGAVALSWAGGGATAQDDGHGGLVGGATGAVQYGANRIILQFGSLPPSDMEITATITPHINAHETLTAQVDSGGNIALALAHGNIIPGSIYLYLTVRPDWEAPLGYGLDETARLGFYDNGNGIFPDLDSAINYVGGTLGLTNPLSARPWWKPHWVLRDDGRFVMVEGSVEDITARIPDGARIDVYYTYGAPGSPAVETFTVSELSLDLTPSTMEAIVPGSLRLVLGDKTYVDLAGSISIYNPNTGELTGAGSLDYGSGRATLTDWSSGANAPSLSGLATRIGPVVVDEIAFRAPGAPVQVGSVTLTATDTAGNTVTATSDNTGLIAASGVAGRFNYKAGVGQVRFGDMVVAAGNEDQPWYSPALVVGGQIWKPRWVLADSIRYNCVTTSYLPVDSTRLGLDVARLPSTGQVPFVEAGNLALVHHTGTVTVPSPTAGATVDLGRADLERLWVRDANGQRVPGDRYTADLDAGTLTWAAPLPLAGYTPPLTVHHRIMHKTYVSDVTIDGAIVLQLPLPHDFPAGSLFSTVLETGDLQGHVERIFSQSIWEGVWSDVVVGGSPDAQYNQVDAPILVSNHSTKDRYALVFQTASTFQVVSKARGILARDIALGADYTLFNHVTNKPEWTVYSAGWGVGWQPGNVLRFDVVGAAFPVEIALTIQAGTHTVDLDHFTLEFMGDI
ncbi:hypothetical protein SAMN02949497_3510 [Methylomagnum ishizawai]|uniref:Uncharacterized protein n=1 Tax=Methylomagnum ishizawai TaxID=1760988 RepID=A0A1Y6D0L6_9GAMM|nr:hypothetical protein [Methylomagnum ishizawai]SMF96126.1 hypothetical protein SAMN02949497_3510 [Methylomagnum ishizawai]